MTDLRLEMTHHLPHSPERVFDAWLDPAMLPRFMMPMPGVTVTEASTDPREGGRFRIVMRAPDGTDIPHEGEYLTIDRPNRLSFTWVSPHSQDDSTVTLDLAARDGGTDLTLSQVRFPSENSRDSHYKGWTGIVEALAGMLESA